MSLRKSMSSRRIAARLSLTGVLLVGLSVVSLPSSAASGVTCTVTVADLAFGSYNTTSNLTGATTVQIKCPGLGGSSLSYTLKATAGSGTYGTRQMSNASQVVTYNLYTTSANSTIWGDGTSGTVVISGTITSPNTNITIYGLVPGSQNVPPASYSTTIPITVTLTYQ